MVIALFKEDKMLALTPNSLAYTISTHKYSKSLSVTTYVQIIFYANQYTSDAYLHFRLPSEIQIASSVLRKLLNYPTNPHNFHITTIFLRL